MVYVIKGIICIPLMPWKHAHFKKTLREQRKRAAGMICKFGCVWDNISEVHLYSSDFFSLLCFCECMFLSYVKSHSIITQYSFINIVEIKSAHIFNSKVCLLALKYLLEKMFTYEVDDFTRRKFMLFLKYKLFLSPQCLMMAYSPFLMHGIVSRKYILFFLLMLITCFS